MTIIHITVIVAALVLGPKDGALVGGVWGMITFIRAFVWPTSPLATIVFTNPLVSVLPRILVGVVAGYTFMWLSKRLSSKILAAGVAAVLGSLTNTVLVLGQIYLLPRPSTSNVCLGCGGFIALSTGGRGNKWFTRSSFGSDHSSKCCASFTEKIKSVGS